MTEDDFAGRLKSISVDFQKKNTAFKRQVEAERNLQDKMIETVDNIILKAIGKVPQELAPFLLAALNSSDAPISQAKVGLGFAKKMLPPALARQIIRSEASEAHLVTLGQMLRLKAEALRRVDPAFDRLAQRKQ